MQSLLAKRPAWSEWPAAAARSIADGPASWGLFVQASWGRCVIGCHVRHDLRVWVSWAPQRSAGAWFRRVSSRMPRSACSSGMGELGTPQNEGSTRTRRMQSTAKAVAQLLSPMLQHEATSRTPRRLRRRLRCSLRPDGRFLVLGMRVSWAP